VGWACVGELHLDGSPREERVVAPDVSRDERTDEREEERASRGGSLRLTNDGAPSEPRREMRACRSEFDPQAPKPIAEATS
jgi:hypothetical protein